LPKKDGKALENLLRNNHSTTSSKLRFPITFIQITNTYPIAGGSVNKFIIGKINAHMGYGRSSTTGMKKYLISLFQLILLN